MIIHATGYNNKQSVFMEYIDLTGDNRRIEPEKYENILRKTKKEMKKLLDEKITNGGKISINQKI